MSVARNVPRFYNYVFFFFPVVVALSGSETAPDFTCGTTIKIGNRSDTESEFFFSFGNFEYFGSHDS